MSLAISLSIFLIVLTWSCFEFSVDVLSLFFLHVAVYAKAQGE